MKIIQFGLFLLLFFSRIATTAAEENTLKKNNPQHRIIKCGVSSTAFVIGYATLDFSQGRVRVPTLPSSYGGWWYKFDLPVKQKDLAEVKKLIEEADLHDFDPELKWFDDEASKENIMEAASSKSLPWGMLVFITWDDRQKAFILPADMKSFNQRSDIPEKSRQTYNRLFQIFLKINEVASKCEPQYKKGASHKKPMTDAQAEKGYRSTWKQIVILWKSALPKGMVPKTIKPEND